MRIIMTLLVSIALAGCASLSQKAPSTIAAPEATAIANDVTRYVATVLPAAATTIWIHLDSAHEDQAFAAALATSLRERGYAVAEGQGGDSSLHRLDAHIESIDDGVVVRFALDDSLVTRFYHRTDGHLQPGGGFALRVTP